MSGFIEGSDRSQTSLFPERLEDWICEDNPVRIVDVFVDALDLTDLGFDRTGPANTGRPGYHPSVLLKLFIYGYLNRVPSSRRLEREANRNVEVMWLMGRLAPDHKTIADFRRHNATAIKNTCAQFVELSRRIGVLGGDRGHSDEHSAFHTDDAASCAYDHGYNSPHSWACIADQPSARLQAFCGLAAALTRHGDRR